TSRPGARRANHATAPIPATVWAPDSDMVDPVAIWPAPIVENIITSFTQPGQRVVIMPWLAPDGPGRGAVARVGAVIADRSAAGRSALRDDEVLGALDTAKRLARHGHVLDFLPETPTHQAPSTGSRPFWADLLDGSAATTAPDTGIAPERAAVP